jgi:hypothetical protein
MNYWNDGRLKIKVYGIKKARRHGLVVRVKIHIQEVVGSNPGPAVETIYHSPLIWIKSMNCGKVTWHCCMCCNPAKGRVEFEDGWLIKSSFITMDEMKACQLTRTKFKKKKKSLWNNQVDTKHSWLIENAEGVRKAL